MGISKTLKNGPFSYQKWRVFVSENFHKPRTKGHDKIEGLPNNGRYQARWYLAYPAGKYLILPFSQKCN
jgi:hypothetical protein